MGVKVLITRLDSDLPLPTYAKGGDAGAFLAIKFWASKGIKIEISDPRDSTPYWLVTSKRGEKLAALLTK